MKKKIEKIILGIDPGSLHMGYGIIKSIGDKIELVCTGTIHLHKLENQQLKLKMIFEKVQFLIDSYHPDECAIEVPFYHENAQSMLKLGRAQGVAMTAALMRDMPVIEYYPKKVKQAITGNGNASKEQVAAMLKTLCNMTKLPTSLDATDALSIAVCHHLQNSGHHAGEKKYTSWKSFVSENENKVKK